MANKRQTSLSKWDTKLLKDFGSRVRQLREKKKLSVYDITGDDQPIRSRQHWQRIERGQKNINLTTVLKVAKCLDVKMEDLIAHLD